MQEMNAIVIRFVTNLFDVSKERPNDINPIYGESLLLWLTDKLKDKVSAVPRPQAEDWGWYVDIVWNDRPYMLGACASDEEDGDTREWILQIEKHRSLKERLLGREKLTARDECVVHLLHLLESEPAFKKLNLDQENGNS